MALTSLDEVKALGDAATRLKTPNVSSMKKAYLATFPHRLATEWGASEVPDLHDNTAADAVISLGTTTNQLLIPQNDKWAGIDFREGFKPAWDIHELKVKVENANKVLFEHFQTSNFYLSVGEAIYDAIIAGTACLAIYINDSDEVTYRHIPVGQLRFLEDHNGNPDVVFNSHKMTKRQLVTKYGLKALPENIREEMKPDKEYEVEEYEIPIAPKGKGYKPTYEYGVYLKGTETRLESAVTKYRTFIVFRWDKSHDIWGMSPIRHALPSITAANEWTKLATSFAEFAAFGLWQVRDDGSLDLERLNGQLKPGMVIPTGETELKVVEFPGNYSISRAEIEAQQAQTRRLTLSDPLPPADKPNYMTAEEVKARQAEFYRRVGQPALRLERELLKPVIWETIKRLQHLGRLEVVPADSLKEMGFKDQSDIFAVTVNSSVKRIMRMNEAQSDIAAINAVRTTFPDKASQLIAKHVNEDKVTRDVLMGFGMVMENMRSEEEAAQFEKQMMEKMNVEQQLAAGEQMASIGEKTASALEKVKGANANILG